MKITRRQFCAAALGGAAVLALSACGAQSAASGSASESASGAASAGSAASAASGSAAAAADVQPFLDPAEYPRVDGSTACIPLMAAMLHETAGVPLEEAQSSISVSTTGYAWENLAVNYDASNPEGYPELLIVYEAPAYIQQEITDKGTQLDVTPIGLDALVFMVNDSNPVQSLTRQQLIDIYGGKITNWKDVGGEDAEIVAFQRSEDSGSQTLFKKLLMGDNPLMTAPTELAPAEMSGLVDSLAAYNNSGNAIGFSVFYYIDQMYSQPGLRLLGVDGVVPSKDTIADGSYPLPNPFYAVIRQDTAAGTPARQLYDWICGEEGRACIAAAGYVPAAKA